MTEQEMLLRKINASKFALWELHIYMDTHENDLVALAKLREHENNGEELRKIYESKYGPLVFKNTGDNTKWSWLKDPWPWELEEE